MLTVKRLRKILGYRVWKGQKINFSMSLTEIRYFQILFLEITIS